MNCGVQSTHYDNVMVAPGSYTSFSLQLTSWDGKKIDMNGVPLSFSITTFPRVWFRGSHADALDPRRCDRPFDAQ